MANSSPLKVFKQTPDSWDALIWIAAHKSSLTLITVSGPFQACDSVIVPHPSGGS